MIDVQAIIEDALANKQDPYTELAKQLFNTQQPSAEQRREAKARYWSYFYTKRII